MLKVAAVRRGQHFRSLWNRINSMGSDDRGHSAAHYDKRIGYVGIVFDLVRFSVLTRGRCAPPVLGNVRTASI